jgi:phage tail-like protein
MDENISRRTFMRVIEVGGVTVTLAGCLDIDLDDLEDVPTDANSGNQQTTMQDQQESKAADRDGPMKTSRFKVQIDDVEVSGWRTVTIPSKSIEQGTYREGDDPEHEKKTWGQVTFDDLEMERGVKPGATELWDWIEDIQAGKADEGRKEIAVKLKDEEGEMMIQWEFREAWITDYDPPDLDASADEMATESVTITFDEMIRVDA